MISCLATFLTESAITLEPPASWRSAKIIPLFKGKGDAKAPENYRSIAITPPFAKVLMALMSQRQTQTQPIRATYTLPHKQAFEPTTPLPNKLLSSRPSSNTA